MLSEDITQRVAEHLGTTLRPDGTMVCPQCGTGDFGPMPTLAALDIYEGGFLPGAPTCVGVCIDCELVVEPQENPGVSEHD